MCSGGMNTYNLANKCTPRKEGVKGCISISSHWLIPFIARCMAAAVGPVNTKA